MEIDIYNKTLLSKLIWTAAVAPDLYHPRICLIPAIFSYRLSKLSFFPLSIPWGKVVIILPLFPTPTGFFFFFFFFFG